MFLLREQRNLHQDTVNQWINCYYYLKDIFREADCSSSLDSEAAIV